MLLPNNLSSEVRALMLAVALFINGPHFAHSYQLFYRDFQAKTRSTEYGRTLRFRYALSGIAVPVVLGAFLIGAMAATDTGLLAAAGNAMAFFVGWNYVKQGYGMLIVDGVMRPQFFTPIERRVMLINAYAVWALTWIQVNIGPEGPSLFGIESASLNLPSELGAVAIILTAATSAGTVWVLYRKWTRTGTLPFNGVTAYLVTLLLWMLFVRMDAIWLVMVPALHSLQYLVVVWRLEKSRLLSGEGAFTSPTSRLEKRFFDRMHEVRFFHFVVTGFILGVLGFWLAPLVLEGAISLVSGASVFLFGFWIFINIHHYFIDTVIWRRGNPEVKRYLFGETPVDPGTSPPDYDALLESA